MTAKEMFDEAGAALAERSICASLELYTLAIQAGHDYDQCAAGRWECYMLLGEFELAWRESDGIAARGEPDPHRFWDGAPLLGRTVLLRCLHGLGDTLQFIRYAPFLRRQVRHLTVEAQPKLKPLLQQAEIADAIITWGEPEPAWDQQVEVMELPRIFRTTVRSIPSDVPYLHIRSTQIQSDIQSQTHSPGPLRVGIVWASSAFNPARSIPIKAMADLFATPGASFLSLQVGEERRELEPWATQVAEWPEEDLDILNTAHALQKLDLLITVDTMTAHLAGALARPVWTLLPYASDWRWMLGRADSPWYPTMRLFRQRQRGDWTSVIKEVKHALLILIAERSFRRTVLPRTETPVRVT